MPDLPLEHEYLPPETAAGGQPPTVVVMHGRGADERDLLPVAHHLPDGLATVSLRAPAPLMGGYTWYDLDMSAGGLHLSQPDPEGFRRSLHLATESVDAAIEAYDLDAARIGLLGFSQGAVMALSLLLEAPSRYAWVSAHHGYLAESHAEHEPAGIEGKPVFIGAGTADQVIPAGRAEAAANRLQEIGCRVTFETYQVGHGIAQEELSALIEFVETHY